MRLEIAAFRKHSIDPLSTNAHFFSPTLILFLKWRDGGFCSKFLSRTICWCVVDRPWRNPAWYSPTKTSSLLFSSFWTFIIFPVLMILLLNRYQLCLSYFRIHLHCTHSTNLLSIPFTWVPPLFCLTANFLPVYCTWEILAQFYTTHYWQSHKTFVYRFDPSVASLPFQ